MNDRFSDRHGYAGAEPPIVVREDAPANLRYAVAQIASDCDLGPDSLRETICSVLYVPPDRNNWSPSNVWQESIGLLEDCQWFKVYDIAEEIHRRLQQRYGEGAQKYRTSLDRFFRDTGIGWSFTEAGIVYRGGDSFTNATLQVREVLALTGRERAASEIEEALRDISRRPQPDTTGALHHAMAAVECTARDVLGDPKPTLGQLVPRLNLPKPLDIAVEKLWGYASESARHIREGETIEGANAELLVTVACAVCSFLAKSSSPTGDFNWRLP